MSLFFSQSSRLCGRRGSLPSAPFDGTKFEGITAAQFKNSQCSCSIFLDDLDVTEDDSHMIPLGNLAGCDPTPAAGRDESGGCHQLHPCSPRDEFLDAISLRTGRSDGVFHGVFWCFKN